MSEGFREERIEDRGRPSRRDRERERTGDTGQYDALKRSSHNGGLMGIGWRFLEKSGLSGFALICAVLLLLYVWFTYDGWKEDRKDMRLRADALQKVMDQNGENLRAISKDITEIKAQQRVNEHFLRMIGEKLEKITPSKIGPGDNEVSKWGKELSLIALGTFVWMVALN